MITIAIYEHPVFGPIRLACQDNTVYYCAKDIAKLMEFGDPVSSVHNHCRNIRKYIHLNSDNRTALMNFIDIEDVYRLAAFSRSYAAIHLFNLLRSDTMQREVSAMFGDDEHGQDEPETEEKENLKQTAEDALEKEKFTEPVCEQCASAAPDDSESWEADESKKREHEEYLESRIFFNILVFSVMRAFEEYREQTCKI